MSWEPDLLPADDCIRLEGRIVLAYVPHSLAEFETEAEDWAELCADVVKVCKVRRLPLGDVKRLTFRLCTLEAWPDGFHSGNVDVRFPVVIVRACAHPETDHVSPFEDEESAHWVAVFRNPSQQNTIVHGAVIPPSPPGSAAQVGGV